MTEHTSRNSITITQSGIEFNILKPSVNIGGLTSNGLYRNGDEQHNAGVVINAVDIDWGNVNLGDLGNINTTGDLINIIKLILSKINVNNELIYSYVGTDLNSLLVDFNTGDLKEDIAEKIKTISGVKTYTTIPASLESGITIEANQNYVYVIAPTSTLNGATTYLVNSANMDIYTETLGTFNIGSIEYTVKCTPSEVGTIETIWKTTTPLYYSYVGTDLNSLLVDFDTGDLKEDIAEKIKTISGVKTYTTIPASLESGITIEANQNYVYVIAPTSTLNGATTYLVNSFNINISTETLGTFNIGSTEYTVKCTLSEVGSTQTAWL